MSDVVSDETVVIPVARMAISKMEAGEAVANLSRDIGDAGKAMGKLGSAIAHNFSRGFKQHYEVFGGKPKPYKRRSFGPLPEQKATGIAIIHIKSCLKVLGKTKTLEMHRQQFKDWTRRYNAVHPARGLDWRRLTLEQMARAFDCAVTSNAKHYRRRFGASVGRRTADGRVKRWILK